MMKITFPGGEKVYAHYGKFTIQTDQPAQDGGDESAPCPFDLFIASIGTCAGYYVLKFCKQRNISYEDVKLFLDEKRQDGRIVEIDIAIHLPETFPAKYVEAVVRAAEQCTVKRYLDNPPKISIKAKKKRE